jgi:hypothetical protein
MDRPRFERELTKAGIASAVAFFVGLILKALGAGKWVIAAGSGAVGGVVAVAMIA